MSRSTNTRVGRSWLVLATVSLMTVIVVAANWRVLWLTYQVQRARSLLVAGEFKTYGSGSESPYRWFHSAAGLVAFAELLDDEDPLVWGRVPAALDYYASCCDDDEQVHALWQQYVTRRPLGALRFLLLKSGGRALFDPALEDPGFGHYPQIDFATCAAEALPLLQRLLRHGEEAGLQPYGDLQAEALLALLAWRSADSGDRYRIDEVLADAFRGHLPSDLQLELGYALVASDDWRSRWNAGSEVRFPTLDEWESAVGIRKYSRGDVQLVARTPLPRPCVEDVRLLSVLAHVDTARTFRIFAQLSRDDPGRAIVRAAVSRPSVLGVARPQWLPLEDAAERFLQDSVASRTAVVQGLAVLQTPRAREILRRLADDDTQEPSLQSLALASLLQAGDESVRDQVEDAVCQWLAGYENPKARYGLEGAVVAAALASGSQGIQRRIARESFPRSVYAASVANWPQLDSESWRLLRFADWDVQGRRFVPPRTMDEWDRCYGVIELEACGHGCGVIIPDTGPEIFADGTRVALAVAPGEMLALLRRDEARVLRLLARLAPQPEQQALLHEMQQRYTSETGEVLPQWFPLEAAAERVLEKFDVEQRLLAMQALTWLGSDRARRALEKRVSVEPNRAARRAAVACLSVVCGDSSQAFAARLAHWGPSGGLLRTRSHYEEHAASLWLTQCVRGGDRRALDAAISTLNAPDGGDELWIVPTLFAAIDGVPQQFIDSYDPVLDAPVFDRTGFMDWLGQVDERLVHDAARRQFVLVR